MLPDGFLYGLAAGVGAVLLVAAVGSIVWFHVRVRKCEAVVADAAVVMGELARTAASAASDPAVAARFKSAAAQLESPGRRAPAGPARLIPERTEEETWAMQAKEDGWRCPHTGEPLPDGDGPNSIGMAKKLAREVEKREAA